MNKLSAKKSSKSFVFLMILLIGLLSFFSYSYPVTRGYTINSPSKYANFVNGQGDNITVYLEGINYLTYQNHFGSITAETYGYSTFNSFLNFSNILAYNVTQEVEVDSPYKSKYLDTRAYMSFQVNMSCYLINITIDVNLNSSDSQIFVYLYNSTWDNVNNRSKYDSPIYITFFAAPDYLGWYTITVNNWYLNTTNTENNTFFIALDTSAGASSVSSWYYVPDPPLLGTDGVDEGYAYLGPNPQDWDFNLKVDLMPETSTPTPSSVNLSINGTNVNDTSYGGTWESHAFFNSNIFFNITSDWKVSFDVNITLSETREDLTYDVIYTAYANNTPPLWNITVNTTMPQTFTEINSTVIKPLDWVLVTIFLNGALTTQYEQNGNNITLMGEGLWNILLNSSNYLAEPQDTPTTYNGKNTSLDFVFAQAISSQNNGSAKITVYNTTGESIVNYTTTPINNGTHNLLQAFWMPDSSLPSGTYNVTALWCNGTEVGYRVKQVILLHPAHITTSYTDTDHLIGDNITIIVNYIRNDTGEGITGATVTGSWVYQSGIIFSDDGNGQYSADVPTYPDYKNGTYQFTITATKPGYQTQTYVVNITLIYKTDLVGDTSYSVQYDSSVTISVTYKFGYNDTTIPEATVYFDFQNGTIVEMKDYDSDGTYTLVVSSNVTAGTYNFIITASKQGYQARSLSGTLTVYNISTQLNPVNETTEYSIYYNVKTNITFYYNDSAGQGITGAATSYISSYENGSLTELGNGYYSLQVTIQDIDTFNFTITVEKKNYQYQTIVIIVTVLSRPTQVEIISNDNYNAGDPFNITIVYKDTLSSNYIPNATINILSNASDVQIFNLNNGTYKIQLVYNTYTAFNESLCVNVTSYGFSTNHSTILYHIMLKSLTSPMFRYDSLVPFAENETIFVYYGVNGTPIIELNVSLDYALISYNNGSYSIILKTDKSNPGSYSVELKVQIINYESFVMRFSFEIEGIPAHTEVVGDSENYWGGEIVLSIYFYDDYNGTYLDNWNLSIAGIPSTVYSTVWLGTHYNLTIYTNKLNATVYPITVTASKLYYNQSSYDISINILKSSFAPEYPQNVSQYENETLTISLTLYDYHFENPVSGATVTLLLEGIEYQAQNPVDGIYVLNISLVGFTPGDYNASLIITKLNYEQYQTDIVVRVLRKYDVVLELILPEKFVAGAENTISAKLTYTNGTPISFERINFDISIKLENNSVIEYHVFDDTDTEGIATVIVSLPEEAKVVSVTAHYSGSVSLKSVTNSGSAVAEPALTVNTVLFGPLSPYFFGSLIAALAAVVAIKQMQARKRRALEEYKLTISYYEDLLKIRHFLIIHKGSGVSMFYKAYGTDPFEPDLISGFITALSQFGTEIVETTSETVELKQKGLYIFATDTKYMRFAIMSSEELSNTFKKILTNAIKSLGEKYDPMVANWRGDLRASKEIGLALENKLALGFFYVPVMIKTTQNLKGKELVVVDKIQKLLKKLPNVNLKQIIDMLGHEDLPVIISLVKRQIIGTASRNTNTKPLTTTKTNSNENKHST